MPQKPTMRITNTAILKKVIAAVEIKFKKGFERLPIPIPKKITGMYLENNSHKTLLKYDIGLTTYIITPIEKSLVPKKGWEYHVPKRDLDNIYAIRKKRD